MNKLTAALLAVLLLLTACAVPAADTPAGGTTAAPLSASTAPAAETTAAADNDPAEGFALNYRGVRLMPGAAADVQSLLGDPDDKLEAPSCVHEGNDTLYYYEGVEIVTSPSGEGETVYSLAVTGEDIPTEEGLTVGMSAEDALRLYGEGEEAFGQYVFVRGATSLKIMTDADGTVTSITYIQNP